MHIHVFDISNNKVEKWNLLQKAIIFISNEQVQLTDQNIEITYNRRMHTFIVPSLYWQWMCCYASTELNFWFYITVLCEFHRLYLLLNLLHCRINVWYTDLAANHWHQEYNRLSYWITILKNTIDCHIELPYSFLVVQYICKYMYKACWKRFPPELNWHSQFRVGPDTGNTFDFTHVGETQPNYLYIRLLTVC